MKKQLFELVRILICYGCKTLKKAVPGIFCLIMGCEPFVEVDLPASQLTGTAVYEDHTTARTALSNIYANIRDRSIISGRPSGMALQLGLYADCLDYHGVSLQPPEFFYEHSILPTNTTLSTWWNQAYNLVFTANAVLEGSTNSVVLTEEEKNELVGESLFIRGLLHFYLVELFGAIPYVTVTDYRINAQIVKKTPQEVYAHLKEDLGQAIELLPETYQGGNRSRPNKAVAQALLARIYLFDKAWGEAESMATAVLDHTSDYMLENDLNKAFLMDSPSTIWQLMPAESGQNAPEAATFMFIAVPPPSVALSQGLVDAFDDGDLRKQYWIGSLTDGMGTWYYPHKYKQRTSSATTLEYSIVMRLEEQYLIRAEARAQQGDIEGARADLNRIRNRAGLANSLASDREGLLEAIMEERRLELFTEAGHRWFDLKRTNRAHQVLSHIKPGWKVTDVLFPIPDSELILNPNLLPQNEGYE